MQDKKIEKIIVNLVKHSGDPNTRHLNTGLLIVLHLDCPLYQIPGFKLDDDLTMQVLKPPFKYWTKMVRYSDLNLKYAPFDDWTHVLGLSTGKVHNWYTHCI